MTFFQIIEEDTDSVASGSSNQLDKEIGFIETAAAKKKKRDSAVDEACCLLRAVKNFGKKCLLHTWRICDE